MALLKTRPVYSSYNDLFIVLVNPAKNTSFPLFSSTEFSERGSISLHSF